MKTAKTSRDGRFLGGVAKVLVVAALAGCFGISAAQDGPTAQSLRAAMVFNFLKFTEFPPASQTDPRLRLCFSVGDPAQADALTALAGRRVWNREVVVTRLGEGGDACQVIYVDSRQRWDAAAGSRAAGGALTISDYRGFMDEGGMIEIDMDADGNRFGINLAQARLAHLRLSPQLLRLARRIHE